MKTTTTTWFLVGGLALAGGAAALWSDDGDDVSARPRPDAPVGPDGAATPRAPAAPAAPGAPAGTVSGTVAEVLQVDSYTYLRLQDGTWAAVAKADVAVGQEVDIVRASPMRDFKSKTLGRTFATIYFGTLAGAPAVEPAAESPPVDIEVPRAEGGVTVAELYGKAAALEGKRVTFAGRITKVTPNVLGRTWLHVQDGSGDAAAKTHDVVVTTEATPAIGDTVTITGTLARNKDLGSGYRYDVLVEEATLNSAL